MTETTAAPSPADHIMGVYSRTPLAFERGEGARLYTTDGDTYLDCMAGIAVNALGHANPKLVAALKAQAEKLWHVSNIFTIPGQEKLAKALTDATFADEVFFTNSGTEAIECAIKTARKYHAASGHPEKFHLITFEGAFHGRTLATIAAGGNPKYIDGFGPKVRDWNRTEMVELWRERWAELANERLAELDIDARVDHRTLEAQGIDLEPQHKIGPAGARRFVGAALVTFVG